VIDAKTQERLQEIIRRESRSEMMYVAQAFPWTSAQGVPAREELLRLAAEEREAIIALGRWLNRRHIAIDTSASFPSRFTTINFLSLAHLLPQLVQAERAGVAALEADLAQTHDAEARAHIEKLLFVKREHAAKLEQLSEPHPSPASA